MYIIFLKSIFLSRIFSLQFQKKKLRLVVFSEGSRNSHYNDESATCEDLIMLPQEGLFLFSVFHMKNLFATLSLEFTVVIRNGDFC